MLVLYFLSWNHPEYSIWQHSLWKEMVLFGLQHYIAHWCQQCCLLCWLENWYWMFFIYTANNLTFLRLGESIYEISLLEKEIMFCKLSLIELLTYLFHCNVNHCIIIGFAIRYMSSLSLAVNKFDLNMSRERNFWGKSSSNMW